MTAAFAEGWARFMLAMSWQVALLVLVVGVLDRLLLRGRWPRLALALWALVLVKLVLPPSLGSPVSVTAEAARRVAPLVEPVPSAAPSGPWLPMLFGVWAAGVVLFALLAARRRRRLRRLAAQGFLPPVHVRDRLRAVCARLRLRRPPEVRLHPAASSAFVFGLRRPVVVLPMRVADPKAIDAEGLDHVLLHEVAHIRRGDLWMQAAFALLAALHWFNPLVAWARRRAHAAREVCCDLTVAGALGDASAYRMTLLRHAACLLARPAGSAGLAGFLPMRSTILVRIGALDRFRGRPAGAVRALPLAAAVVVGCALLPMAFDAPVPDVLEAPLLQAELEAAYAHLDDTLRGDARYGCFDKRFAWFDVVRLEAARDAQLTPDRGGGSP